MFKRINVVLTSFILIAMLLAPIAPVQAKLELVENPVNLVDAKGNSIRFEVRVPIDELLIETVELDGENYSQISLQGFDQISQQAAPQLPMLTEAFGAPFDSEVAITVVPGRAQRIALNAPVSPVMTESVDFSDEQLLSGDFTGAASVFTYHTDPEIYDRMPSYPNVFAEITNDGQMRSQRLLSIAVYPVQYDLENQELVVYENLEVNISFSGAANALQSEPLVETDAFESLFQDTLLNYQQAKAWRKIQAAEIQTNGESWMPPVPGYRIKVQKTGMYKMSITELANAGIPTNTIDYSTVKMYHLGEEIAIQVIPGDGIVFYGEENKSKYTKDNVYWLTYGGTAGLRMQTVDGTPTSAPTPISFLTSEHYETDLEYRSLPIDVDDYDRYVWDFVRRFQATVFKKINQTITLGNYAGDEVSFKMKLVGFTQAIMINPDHYALVNVNGSQVGEASWDGVHTHEFEGLIPANLIQNKVLNLEITAKQQDYDADLFFLDWFELSYQRDFGVTDNRLSFGYETDGNWTYELTGFTGSNVEVYDISNPDMLKRFINNQVVPDNGKFNLRFSDSVSEPKKYFATTNNGYLTVQAIEADSQSNLHAQSHGADLLLISHQSLMTPAESLKTHKISMGLRTELIDVQDIYDEFNYGIPSPYAIQSFIAYAYQNWQTPAPAYVILIGDGHFDPRNNEKKNRLSLIPPFLLHVDGAIGETSADNRFAAVVGDDILPDLMLGRISVNTIAEAQAHIDKIIAYETNPPDGEWKHRILAVADKPEIAHYPHLSDAILSEYFPSEPFYAQRVYWGWDIPDRNVARAMIQEEFNNGVFLVNYIGHAGYSSWSEVRGPGDQPLLRTVDIPNLLPQERHPVILANTCMEGFFLSPHLYGEYREAMGEVITRVEGKGAVASWSPTGWGAVIGHDYTNRGFFKAVYQDGVNILGQATHAGLLRLWQSGRYLDLIDTTLLFGDPSMKLQTQLTAIYDEYELDSNTSLTVSAAEGVLTNDINPTGNPVSAVLVENVQNGNLNLNSDGSFVYTPSANFHGFDSFSYKVSDGIDESNTVPVYLYVGPRLVANPDEYSGDSNLALSVSASEGLLANDINPTEDDLTITVVEGPSSGVLNLSQDGSFVYTPSENTYGVDSFTYKINTWNLESNVTSVELEIKPNLVAVPDEYSMFMNKSLVVPVGKGLLVNDINPSALPVNLILVSNVSSGDLSLTQNGAFQYKPNQDFYGIESFSYKLRYGMYESEPAQVKIFVLPPLRVYLPLVLR
ncbi:MAG: tandem-95 repeat protein [Anaerolineaceae bacterium]|nr:tandem-95 repeat protein [Anaerolineaceae bacterium]